MQRDAEPDEVKGAGESLEPYLGKGGVQVALELVSLMQGILEPALCGYQSFLTLPKGLQQLLSLVQHVHHQLLKVGVRIGTVGGPQRVPLIDCGHHLTHGGNGENLLSVGSGGGVGGSSQGWHLHKDPGRVSRNRQCQTSGQLGRGFSHGISCSCSERSLGPAVSLWDGARRPGLTFQGWGSVPCVPTQAGGIGVRP